MSDPSRTRRRPPRSRFTAGLAVAVVVLAAAVSIALPRLADAATTLEALAAASGKEIGFAMATDRMGDTAYRAVADTEFSLVAAENAMKWNAVQPSRGQFSWSDADQVADYARGGGRRLYGHTLVWHGQLPSWVSGIQSGGELLQVMREHITTVMTRYRGQVTAWDVVNEVFDGGNRRNTVFQQRIGDSYIEEAFRAARAADPDASLCINDFSTDAINAKSTAIYHLVRDFKARGVPIDCVGFQTHLIINQVPGDFQQNLQRFVDLGVDVRITELDIRMNTPATAANLTAQANDYRRVVQACLAISRCNGFTLWGITDRYSWVPGLMPGQGAALLWDDDYNKKPAYHAVTDALGGASGAPTGAPD